MNRATERVTDGNNCCPYCNADQECATGLGHARAHRPAPGDLSICLYCAEYSAFTNQLTLRKLTSWETNLVTTVSEYVTARNAVLKHPNRPRPADRQKK